MKKVVILGSGLATRLRPITNHIPKVLVNYKQHTILKHLHETYKDLGAEAIIVVVHSKFRDVVQSYADQHNLPISVLCVDEAYGSAYALSRIAHHLNGHNVVLNWCDVIPEFDNFKWNSDSIYTFGDECRYSFDGNEIKEVGQTGGNIVGVYQSSNFNIKSFYDNAMTHLYFNGKDYIETLKDLQSIQQEPLKDLIDLGDYHKLISCHKSKEYSRDFNSLEILDDKVIKTALTPQALELQDLERRWYDSVHTPSVAKTYPLSGNTLCLERIKGVPLFEIWDTHTLSEVFEALNFSDEVVTMTKEDVDRDHYYEIVTKIKDRCKSIQSVVDSFPSVKRVNGIELGRLDDMLERAYRHIIDSQIDKPYTIIHGDPNFSNLMGEDATGKIRIIDPRGYFGKTKIYGPKMYDEAKVLYALSGYDNFNSSPTWGALEINDHGEAFIAIEPLCETSANSPVFTDLHHLWNAIIWLGLGGYFKNNPLKSVSAYYYGMMLLSKQLDKMGRKLEDGSCVKTLLAPVNFSISTKCPGKWLLTDLETGESYRPNLNSFGYKSTGHEWSKV